MVVNNCTQYLLSLIIIISTWEPVVPLCLSLEQKPRSMGRDSAVSASPLGFARSQWSRRHLGSEQGSLLCVLNTGPIPSHFTEVLFHGVPVPRPPQPLRPPSACSCSLQNFCVLLHGDPEQTLIPQCPDLCELHRAESMFITCTLANLWSSSVSAMFRFTCLRDFFPPLKNKV